MRKLIEMEEYVPPQLKLPPQFQVSLEQKLEKEESSSDRFNELQIADLEV